MPASINWVPFSWGALESEPYYFGVYFRAPVFWVTLTWIAVKDILHPQDVASGPDAKDLPRRDFLFQARCGRSRFVVEPAAE